MKYPFKSHFNSIPDPGQVFTMPSETIQGQTLSIAQMLQRINSGSPVSLTPLEYSETDEPLPRITDLTDVDDIRQEVDSIKEREAKRRKQLEIDFENKKVNKPTDQPE